MPTNRLHIKFSKTAFLNILKYAIKRACLYVCYHKYTAPKISVSELIVAFSIVNSMQSPDETYRGVEIVGGVRNTFEYSDMKCLYNKPNFTSKHCLKMH